MSGAQAYNLEGEVPNLEQVPAVGVNYYLVRKKKRLKSGEERIYLYLVKVVCMNGQCERYEIGNVEEIDRIMAEYKKRNPRPYRRRRKKRSPAPLCPRISVLAGPGGFEPPTTGLGGQRSILAELRARSLSAFVGVYFGGVLMVFSLGLWFFGGFFYRLM